MTFYTDRENKSETTKKRKSYEEWRSLHLSKEIMVYGRRSDIINRMSKLTNEIINNISNAATESVEEKKIHFGILREPSGGLG